MSDPILVARQGEIECLLLPGMANRHGLITGATGTGKTITLQTLAENFSRIGVPVFMADVKGDLTGISQTGAIPPKVAKILEDRGLVLRENDPTDARRVFLKLTEDGYGKMACYFRALLNEGVVNF